MLCQRRNFSVIILCISITKTPKAYSTWGICFEIELFIVDYTSIFVIGITLLIFYLRIKRPIDLIIAKHVQSTLSFTKSYGALYSSGETNSKNRYAKIRIVRNI